MNKYIVIFGNFVAAVGPFDTLDSLAFLAHHEVTSEHYDPEPRFERYRDYSVTQMRLLPPKEDT